MIIIDTHQDQKAIGNFPKSLLNNLKKQTSLKMLKKSNVKLFFYSIYSDPATKNVNLKIEGAINEAKKELKKYNIILVKNKSDIKKISEDNKNLFAILHIEGLYGIKKEADIDFLNKWFSLGIRSFGLVWSKDNFLGGGCNGNPNKGLTKLGEDVVKFLNKKRAIIDLSHANYKTFFNVMERSELPPIITHAAAFDICKLRRNLKKEQIIKIKNKNSFIGIFFDRKKISRKKHAEIDDLINHIDYFKKLIGVDYLGIGSDLGGIRSGTVIGLENILSVNNLFERLRQRGYKKEELKKIANKNILKVLMRILPIK